MQETHNNCFGSKKHRTTLLQAKTGKHECWNVTAMYISALVLTCFRLKKGRAMFFRPETIVVSFLHLMVLFFKVLLNHSSKRQFLVLHWIHCQKCPKTVKYEYIFFNRRSLRHPKEDFRTYLSFYCIMFNFGRRKKYCDKFK